MQRMVLAPRACFSPESKLPNALRQVFWLASLPGAFPSLRDSGLVPDRPCEAHSFRKSPGFAPGSLLTPEGDHQRAKGNRPAQTG